MFEFPQDEIALTKELIAFARELPAPVAKTFLLQVYKLYTDWKFQMEEYETQLLAQQEAELAAEREAATQDQ